MPYNSNEERFRLFYIPVFGGVKPARKNRQVEDSIKFVGDLVGRRLPCKPASIKKTDKAREQQPYCRLLDHVRKVEETYHKWETEVQEEYRNWETQAKAMGTFNEVSKKERKAQIETDRKERMRQIAEEERAYLVANYPAIEPVGSRDVQMLESIRSQLESLESEPMKEMLMANLLKTASSFGVQLNASRQARLAFEDDNSDPSSSGDTRMAPLVEHDPAAADVEHKPNAKRFKRPDSQPSFSGDAKRDKPLALEDDNFQEDDNLQEDELLTMYEEALRDELANAE